MNDGFRIITFKSQQRQQLSFAKAHNRRRSNLEVTREQFAKTSTSNLTISARKKKRNKRRELALVLSVNKLTPRSGVFIIKARRTFKESLGWNNVLIWVQVDLLSHGNLVSRIGELIFFHNRNCYSYPYESSLKYFPKPSEVEFD